MQNTEEMNIEKTRIVDPISMAAALLACTAYLILSFWVLSEGHLHEDAYILFNYAEHLASGDGIVYFADGEHTEGATDFLWMVFLAFLTYLGMDIGIAAAILNGLGIGLITYLLTRNLPWKGQVLSKLVAGVFFALLVITSEITYASISGFGAAFYASISILIIHLYLNARVQTMRLLPWVSLLLGLIRPDGVIVGIIASLLALGKIWGTKYRVSYLYNMATVGVLGVVYFVWRLAYFGHVLPLPLYVKSYSASALPGLWANLEYLMDQAPLLLIAALTFALVRDIRTYILAFLPVIALLAALTLAHQSQNIGHRFQAPVTSALFFSLSLFLGAYLTPVVAWKRIMVIILIIPTLAISTGDGPKIYGYLINKNNPDYMDYFPFLVRDIFTPNTKLALTEAGRMAYWTDANTYDLIGLNTSHVATRRLDIAYLVSLDPDVIFIHTAKTLKPLSETEGDTLKVTVDFVNQCVTEKLAWQEIEDPLIRAPYVVYEYLMNNPDKYRLVLARYRAKFSHLYAVKIGGEVNWYKFMDRLEASFHTDARRSYLEIKHSR